MLITLSRGRMLLIGTAALTFIFVSGPIESARSMACASETQLLITFSGGHETDPRDHGRPVVLVAAALGVTPEVFRTAFQGVTPARSGRPSPQQARSNKDALMRVLKPYGITNERLDTVSDYYRYRPQDGELWTNTPAKAYALAEDGKIKKIVVTDRGSGYSSPPQATIKEMKNVSLAVTLLFNKDFASNGSIAKIEVIAPSSLKKRTSSEKDSPQ
jgi:hypothetical protein